MSNPILRGVALSTEFYRSHRLENYKTDEGQAISKVGRRQGIVKLSPDFNCLADESSGAHSRSQNSS